MIDIIVEEKDLTFNRLEKEIYAFGCQIACEILKNILETMDKKLAKERDKSIYRHKGTRQITVKTLVGYEGWKETSKDRYELVNKVTCVGFEDISKLCIIKETMIAREYNVNEIQMRILNGDGASNLGKLLATKASRRLKNCMKESCQRLLDSN